MVSIRTFVLVTAFIISPLPLIPAAPSDTRTEWRVGIAIFSSGNLPAHHGYLERSLPQILYEAVASADIHVFSGEETERYRDRILTDYREAVTRELWSLRAQLDENSLSSGGRGQRDTILEQIGEKERALLDSGAARVNIETEKPVVFAAAGDSPILPKVEQGLGEYCRSRDLDFLVTGTVTNPTDTTYIVKVVLYDANLDAIDEIRTAGGPERIVEEVEIMGGRIKEKILGREWSTIRIVSDVDGAMIEIGGAFRGVGTAEAENITPGAYTITVRAPGFLSRELTVTVGPGETAEIGVGLERLASREVLVETYPQGAAVYVGSLYRGTAPVFLRETGEESMVIAALDGYHDESFVLGRDVRDTVVLDLLPSSVSAEDLVRDGRHRFYRSLGAFALSMPVPFYFWYSSIEHAVAFPMAEGAERVRHARLGEAYYYSYLATFFVAGSLLIDTLSNLFRYLSLQERYGGS